MYKCGQSNEHFNLLLFFAYLCEGFAHAAVCFFYSIYLFNGSTSLNGQDNDQWIASTAMFTYIVIVVNLKMALLCITWVWWTHLFFWFSIGVWFLWIIAYCSDTYTYNMLYVGQRLLGMPVLWLGLVVVVMICIFPELAYSYIQKTYYPTMEDQILENLDDNETQTSTPITSAKAPRQVALTSNDIKPLYEPVVSPVSVTRPVPVC